MYLFKALQEFGFGNRFISTLKNLYESPTAVIKHCGLLLEPIPLKSGIRQGCPISESLYVLCFEVLMHNFRLALCTKAIDLAFTERKLVAFAYADDLLLFATDDESFNIIKQTLDRYELLSNAKVNYDKSKGLWCGQWKNRRDNLLGVRWTNTNIKYLGLNIGEGADTLNDNAVQTKLNSCINSYGTILKNLSLRTRPIVINYLVASSIWHILKAHTPSEGFIKGLQRKLLHHFWLGRRWLPETTLYHRPENGGLGLVSIVNKIESFHMRTLQSIIYAPSTLVSSVFHNVLDLQQQQHNNINTHFIFLEPKPPYPTVWSPDICKIAATWSRYRSKYGPNKNNTSDFFGNSIVE